MHKHTRISWLVALVLMAWPMSLAAEPIAMEQAPNVTGRGGFEVGANVTYDWSSIEQQGIGTTVDKSIFEVPLFVRVGISAFEGLITVPYGNVRTNVDDGSGEINFSGIRDIGLLIKAWLMQSQVFNGSVGVSATFPTAEPGKYLGQGLSTMPFAALGLDLRSVRIHGTLGYQVTTKYDVTTNPATNETVRNVTLQPGNAFNWALGLEVPIPSSPLFSFHTELLGTNFGELKLDGNALPDSSGATLALVPGVRLTALPIKAKVGVAIPIQNEGNNTTASPRSNWKVLAGVSFQLSSRGPNANAENGSMTDGENSN